MNAGGKKALFLVTAKQLVWERGVAATSCGMIIERCGLKKGSLYHYYEGKRQWAGAAIEALSADLRDETSQIFGSHSGLSAVAAYLLVPRNALAGCRLGRLAFDPYVVSDIELRAPIERYFEELQELLRSALHEVGCDAQQQLEYADAICAVVQGGYVLSSLRDDAELLPRACRGLYLMLRQSVTSRSEEVSL